MRKIFPRLHNKSEEALGTGTYRLGYNFYSNPFDITCKPQYKGLVRAENKAKKILII